jgi:hypothetical protein
VKKVTAVIAGIRVSLLSHDQLFKPSLGETFVSDAIADITLTVHCDKRLNFKKKERVFDSGQTWSLFRSRGRYVLQNDTLGSDSHPHTFITLDPRFTSGEIYFSEKPGLTDSPVDPLPYPLNQVLVIILLSQGRGVLLHACGIRDRDKGYLFLGNSGHGKSTMAKLWHDNGATVLNDDRIVVREKDGVLWMYGTPWHGDFKECSSEGQILDRVFFLSRGNGNAVSPKRGAEAVSMLLTRCFPPLWDKEGMAFTMDFCHRITERVPCYELSFVPDERIVDFVRNI